MVRWARAVIRTLDVKLQISGSDLIEAGRPYLVLPLHDGLVDIAVLLSLSLPMTFVTRADLADEEPFDRLLQASDQILINPEAPSALRTVMRETAQRNAQGRSVVMFPQGSVLGIETAFQKGAFDVARTLELEVLPVVIAGTHKVWDHPFSPLISLSQPVFVQVLAPRRVKAFEEYRTLEREMKTLALNNTWARARRYVPERDGYWDGYRFDIDPDYPDVADGVARHRRARESERAAETAERPSL